MSTVRLNPAQHDAVEHFQGPLLVLAGAGSGKTRVITHRIARLIERGVPPDAIVALTFTNKAAGEMAERVDAIRAKSPKPNSTRAKRSSRGPKSGRGSRGRSQGDVTISTFHSFGLRLLSTERDLERHAFTIFDQGDCVSLVKELLRPIAGPKAYDAAAILTRISNAKNAFLSADELPDDGVDPYDEITKVVFEKYQSSLKKFRAFDFDDLVCEVTRRLRERPNVLERLQNRFQFVLVDEYQDTNRAQLEFLRLLADRHRNICVVGDDDQAIYAWRGADVRNILEFEEHFQGAKIVKLVDNYRSREPIISAANAVIAQRQDSRHEKRLVANRGPGSRLVLATAPTPEAEAIYVARCIDDRIRQDGTRPRDIAVLYRSNGQAKLIEEALREQMIPYRLIGGQQFFERKEVKDILAYMKLALNRSDEISLRRVINYPSRGIGDATVDRLETHALAHGWTLWQAIERADAIDGLTPGARAGCRALEAAIGELRKALLITRTPASDCIDALSEHVGLKQDILASSPSGKIAERRWGNVSALVGTFKRREQRERERGIDIADPQALRSFLQALTLRAEEGAEEEEDKVTLSTLHGSKGLEFNHVHLIGCEEGYLPHSRTIDQRVTDAIPQDIEEERRLFYVGITRAKDTLVLSHASHRNERGKAVPRTPSRFLADLPDAEIDRVEVQNPHLSTEASVQNAEALLAALDALG